ncbi:glucosamine-6-phosphate deaminase [Myroides sp. LJL119]
MKNIYQPFSVLNDTIKVYEDDQSASVYVAGRIANIIENKQSLGQSAILGLATGATPKGVYKELIRLHKNEGLSFNNVITFNLDEYYPMQPVEELSYVSFMNTNLFNHIDINKNNIHIPDGTLSNEAIREFCLEYDKKISALGGLDMQLLGIGRTGHIGFNEPGSVIDSTTRLVTLNDLTRSDAIDDFKGLENVPTHAITMGIKTITEAKEIILLALSERKAEIMQKALEGEISAQVPATYLKQFSHVEYVLDQGAAKLLQSMEVNN